MMVVTLVSSLAIVTSVLSQSAKQESGIPEPFVCSKRATTNDLVGKEIEGEALLHCRVEKLECPYHSHKKTISCVSTEGLFK